ncbi:hypothetical protein BH18ACI4_BH18ACI4_13260 [soil metagenome]
MSADAQHSVPQVAGLFSQHSVDVRTICALRLLLSSTALLIVYIDPSKPSEFAGLIDATLVLYTLYSGFLKLLSIRNSRFLPLKIMHWLDVAWYIPLIALSNGTNGIFFFVLLAVLAASSGWGFWLGIRVTLVSIPLFTFASSLMIKDNFDLNRFLLRPTCLLILAYMIARWSGDLRMRNRLGFMREVTGLANTRFGIDRTTNAVLERLRSLYQADSCLLIMSGHSSANGFYRLHRVNRKSRGKIAVPQEIPEEMARIFLPPSSTHAVIYRKSWWERGRSYLKTGQFGKKGSSRNDKLATTLDATSFLAVPIANRNELMGCLYISGGPRRFDHSDIDFVMQLIDHITPVLENIRLVDNLTSEAAEQERRRIANDIHDSVIQPYLGLQFGLAAICEKLEAGNADLVKDARQLLDLTNQELAQLRSFVWGLRGGEQRRDVLLPALQRFAAKFSAVTGINVEVEAKAELRVYDGVAGELFQIVAEALSNVRRHTRSGHARVEIARQDGSILLQIKNNHLRANGNGGNGNNGNHHANTAFTPRSISERVALLGGETQVYTDENDYTVVSVGIPQ